MKKIFVGNFAFTVKEDYLRSLFEPFGAVESVAIVTDRETGRARGFGFIEMPNDAEAEKAIAALNGSDAGGRPLNVSEARPKTERGDLRGSGRDNYRDSKRKPRRDPRW
jgi:RNA recognition motif-containing protein